jgi:hypothetical protein
MSPELGSCACNRRLEESMDEGLSSGVSPEVYMPLPRPKVRGFIAPQTPHLIRLIKKANFLTT